MILSSAQFEWNPYITSKVIERKQKVDDDTDDDADDAADDDDADGQYSRYVSVILRRWHNKKGMRSL